MSEAYCDITVAGLDIDYLYMSKTLNADHGKCGDEILWLKVNGCNRDKCIEITIPDGDNGSYLALSIDKNVAKHMIKAMEYIIREQEEK